MEFKSNMGINLRTRYVLIGVIPFFSTMCFLILNFLVLNLPFNIYEVLMFILVSVFCTYSYFKNCDFLDPMFYFPILYFLLYWLGNFTFQDLYPVVPSNLWALFFVGLMGFFLGSMIISILKIKIKPGRALDTMSLNSRYLLFFIFIICVVSKSIIFLKNGVPIFANNIDASRQSAAEEFGILKVISSAYPIIAIYFFYDFIMSIKKKKVKKYLNILVVFIAFLLGILEGSRILVIQMVIPMFLIWNVKIKKVSIKKLLIYVFIILVFIGTNKFLRNISDDPNYYSYVMGTRDMSVFGNIMLSSFNSFRIGIDCLRQLVNIVPDYSGYTHGQMFMNSILSVLPGKQIIIGYYVSQLLGLNFDGMGAATTILGLFYLDGGPILVFIGMFLFSMLICYNYKKNILTKNVYLTNLVSIYIIYYSIYCLRTNVMPNIDPILTLAYYSIISFIIKKVR